MMVPPNFLQRELAVGTFPQSSVNEAGKEGAIKATTFP
jgi:hypothetical protein